METILKIPLYLKVVSGGTDRAIVTKTVQNIILPNLVRHIAERVSLVGSLDKGQIDEVKAAIGNIDIEVLTDVQALIKKI